MEATYKKEEGVLPFQPISSTKKNQKWREKTLDAIIASSDFSSSNGRRARLEELYKLYAGIIDDSEYKEVLRPYGKTINNLPAKIRNSNIIRSNIKLLIGEFIKRPLNANVIVKNADVNTIKEQEKSKRLAQSLMSVVISKLAEAGLSEPTEVEPPKEVLQAFERTYKDTRAIIGNHALSYIMEDQEVHHKDVKGVKHFLITGMAFTLREIINDNVVYSSLHPMNVDFDKSPEVEFIEDGSWAVHRRFLTISDVLKDYHRFLDKSQVDRLENIALRGGGMPSDMVRFSDILHYDDEVEVKPISSHPGYNRQGYLEVYDVYWKSIKKIGIVTFIDDFGIPQKREVTDIYETAEGEEVEWLYVPEVWSGTKILIDNYNNYDTYRTKIQDGKSNDIYINIKPEEFQYNDLDDKGECKLPINGKTYNDGLNNIISLVELCKPFQLLHNVYNYRLEEAVAKSKGIIAQIDINLKPENYSVDDWFYYMDKLGFLLTNNSAETFNPNHHAKSLLDFTIKNLRDLSDLVAMVEDRLERFLGITRQRKGQITPYDGQGTTEHAIINSANVTEEIFYEFSRLIVRDLNALLNLSKIAWINGKKVSYLMPDYTQAFIEIDGLQHLDSDYGVFATTSSKEEDKIRFLKSLVQPMIQNGTPLSVIAAIMDTDNYTAIKEKIAQAEESASQAAEAQRKFEQQQQQMAMQIEQATLENENNQRERDRENRIEIARIQAASRQQTPPPIPLPDQVDTQMEERKMLLEEAKHRDTTAIKKEELDVKRQALNKKPQR